MLTAASAKKPLRTRQRLQNATHRIVLVTPQKSQTIHNAPPVVLAKQACRISSCRFMLLNKKWSGGSQESVKPAEERPHRPECTHLHKCGKTRSCVGSQREKKDYDYMENPTGGNGKPVFSAQAHEKQSRTGWQATFPANRSRPLFGPRKRTQATHTKQREFPKLTKTQIPHRNPKSNQKALRPDNPRLIMMPAPRKEERKTII